MRHFFTLWLSMLTFPAFSTLAKLVPHFHVPQFPPVQTGAANSCLAFSVAPGIHLSPSTLIVLPYLVIFKNCWLTTSPGITLLGPGIFCSQETGNRVVYWTGQRGRCAGGNRACGSVTCPDLLQRLELLITASKSIDRCVLASS